MPTNDKTPVQAGLIINASIIQNLIDSVETYTFKHVPLTGISGNPNVVKITPGALGASKVNIDGADTGIVCEGYSGEKAVPAFQQAANYAALPWEIRVRKEQEEDSLIDFGDGTYPNVDANGNMIIKMYRGGAGDPYQDGGNYCTIILNRL